MPGTANKRLEKILSEREEPLIDLGLACYGWEAEVVGALYNKATSPSRTPTEAEYQKGLRIACLSNQCVSVDSFFREFPDSIIGKDETRRILANADWDEAEALICNPCVSDSLLQALYERGEPFLQFDDERWRALVALSRNNSRLITKEDDDDGPDLGSRRIQRAIFKSLRIAPATEPWLHTWYNLLGRLAPQTVARPDEINQVLQRWASVAVDNKGKPAEGYFTSAPLREEFCCLIAALYGEGFHDNKSVFLGSPDASDLALRCAYYAHAPLTANDMKKAHARDGDVFGFSALCNDQILLKPELRKLLEEEYLTRSLADRYRWRCEQLHKRYRWFRQQPAVDWLAQDAAEVDHDALTEKLGALVVSSDKKVTDLAKQIQSIKIFLEMGIVILAVLILFRK